MTEFFDLEVVRQRIKTRMDELGTSAIKVSEASDLGDTYVSDLLSGKNKSPSHAALKSIANTLNCRITYLTGEEDPMNASLLRKAAVKRKTKETDVEIEVNLDGAGRSQVATGIGFLDHMLDLLARHSRIDITVKAKGDLHIDHHHTTEDVGIALGQAVKQALGDMKGITRYANVEVPMDEALTRVAIDISGRPFLVFKAEFVRDKVGEFDTELVQEWFQAFAMNSGITLHAQTLYGTNDHHIAESCFKGLARALRAAVAIDPRAKDEVPSTKGSLGG